jgi:hypothetical protein
MQQLPPGWATHPQNPQWAYEVANPSNMQPMTAFQALAAPPAQQAPAAQLAPTEDPFAGYQGMTQEQWDQDVAEVQRAMGMGRGQDRIYIEHEKFDEHTRIGTEVHLLVRLLPWRDGEGNWHYIVNNTRHRVFAQYDPTLAGKNRKFTFPNCYDQKGGPGDCPLCKVCEIGKTSQVPGASEHIGNFNPKTDIVWQAIDVENITRHYQQQHDDAGQPVIDASGQPVWTGVPGILKMRRTLYDKITTIRRHGSDPTDPDNGFPLRLIKRKTGPDKMNVAYDALPGERSALTPEMRAIAANAMDLKKELLHFRPREEMEAIAEQILARFGLRMESSAGSQVQVPMQAPVGQWLPHPSSPGYEFNTTTHAVRAAAPAAPPVQQALPQVPAAPPAPQQAAPPPPPQQAPAPAPQQAPPPPPPVQAAPPAAPPNLPPAAAPGLPPAPPAPQQAPPPPPPVQAAPPAPAAPAPQQAPPPPAPGMPDGTQPQAATMTPEQLEQSLGAPPAPPGGNTGEIPF